jgi:hypothetical protein
MLDVGCWVFDESMRSSGRMRGEPTPGNDPNVRQACPPKATRKQKNKETRWQKTEVAARTRLRQQARVGATGVLAVLVAARQLLDL